MTAIHPKALESGTHPSATELSLEQLFDSIAEFYDRAVPATSGSMWCIQIRPREGEVWVSIWLTVFNEDTGKNKHVMLNEADGASIEDAVEALYKKLYKG